MDLKCLTTREVARLCHVSDATVKRWEDAGLLRSERTSGGHRRFRAEEVARFQKDQKLGIKQCPGDESVVTAPIRRTVKKGLCDTELFESMIAGREEDVACLLISDYLNGSSITDIFDGPVSRSMNRIGELWYEGRLSVCQEHLATRAVMCAVHKLRGVIPVVEPCGRLAFCLSIEGDFHELPTHLVQVTLEQEGWEVLNFGANTPLFSVIDEVLKNSPDLVCISSTVMGDIERASHDYAEFKEKTCNSETRVMLGGQAFKDEKLRNRFSADFFPVNLNEVASILRTSFA